MKKTICIAAAISIALVIAIYAGSGNDRGHGAGTPPNVLSLADVPEMINYQGVLKNTGGTPLDTTVSMTFTIYDAPTGGTALWSETQGSVTTSNGLFNVLLGSSTTIPPEVFEEPNRWLGVAVGADPEMSPRPRIASSAYSYTASYADDADLLDGKDASEFASTTHEHDASDITSGTLDDGRIPSEIARDSEVDAALAAHHEPTSDDHDDRYYTEEELNTSDGNGPNTGSNRIHWDNLVGIPSGFADGTDDTSTGTCDLTQVDAGTGIVVTNPTGPTVTVSADIGTSADQVAAGDHNHDADYINDGGGEIDGAGDFNFSASTFITNLDADFLDGQEASAFAGAAHTHGGNDITSGAVGTDYFSAYDDLSAEGKIGTGATQVAAGDHNHDADYINDGGGEIDAAGDFGFPSSTFITNLDADLLDGNHASDLALATHNHDADYINDGGGEINTAGDFGFPSSTFITNLDADLLDGQHASDFLSAANDYGRSDVATNLYEGTTALSAKYLGITAKAADADALDGHDYSYFATATHIHSGNDITSGTVGTDYFSAYDDLSAEGKIGSGATQVAAGDHNHDADYINDGGGEIDGADDFNFSVSTFITNLDADQLDGNHASDLALATHDHDADYINDGGGEINTAGDFGFPSSTFITNLDADLLDGQHASDFLSASNDYGRSGVSLDLYEGTTALSAKYLGITAKAANADALDGHDSSYFATATHTHSGNDITLGTVGTDYYSAYDDLSAEGKIGSGATQVSAGDHNHDADYINDGGGEIDGAGDFNFSVSTFITNLDADQLDGNHASDLALATHNHDADYVNVAGPETITASSSSPTLTATNTEGTALQGETSSYTNAGVYGKGTGNAKCGVYGTHMHSNGRGVYGTCGLWGSGTGVHGKGGLYGVYGQSTASGGCGVIGISYTGSGYGVHGISRGGIAGVYGQANGSSTTGGYFTSDNYRGLYAKGGGGNEAAYLDGDVTVKGDMTADNDVSGNTLTSTVGTGTSPLTVSSTTLVTNLNTDQLDGQNASDFASSTHNHDADYVNEGQSSSVTSDMIVDGTIQTGDLSFTVPDGHSLDAADGSPTDALYVDNDGEVGIGTTTPGYKLDVAGDINTTGDVRKNGSAYTWPDYVFEPGYKLMSLPDLRAFVDEKKHLPNVPSAEQVRKEGVKLFEQNRLMLEKLEEVYLYIFQLEEGMSQLRERMANLEEVTGIQSSDVH